MRARLARASITDSGWRPSVHVKLDERDPLAARCRDVILHILVFKAASYFTDGAPVAKILPKMDHEGIESIRTKYALQQFIRAMTAPPEFFESPLITDRIARGDISLNEIDVSERTHDICLACIARKGCEIRFVPQQLRCALFDRQAVMIDSWAFGYLNCDSKTEELLLDAMRRSLVFDVGM